jgi:hypothetical protein
MSPAEYKAYRCARALLRMGIYPTPTRMYLVLHRRKHNNLNGRETRARTLALLEFGFTPAGEPGDRWAAPEEGWPA